jgi:hypothetical protein
MPEEYLARIDAATRRIQRHAVGYRGTDRIPTGETVGAPDEGSPDPGAEATTATPDEQRKAAQYDEWRKRDAAPED